MGFSDIHAKADTRLQHKNTADWPTTASVVQMKRGRLVGARRVSLFTSRCEICRLRTKEMSDGLQRREQERADTRDNSEVKRNIQLSLDEFFCNYTI